ncbi:hypothetical protein GbCGDNIH6_8176 [Granulibacter bethesdensis]|nr:hypothetical protein GbCGDNIH6_8176 [Granulibacter bethesdensis]
MKITLYDMDKYEPMSEDSDINHADQSKAMVMAFLVKYPIILAFNTLEPHSMKHRQTSDFFQRTGLLSVSVNKTVSLSVFH